MFTVVIPQRVEGPDPHEVVSSVSRSVLRSAFETLVDREHSFRPGLAANWSLRDDTTWVFELRPGVVCHDGEPFTAESVVATCERFTSPTTRNIMAGALSAVRRISAKDDLTVVFETERPTSELPLALGRVPMMSTGSCRGSESLAGTGPFRLLGIEEERATFESFDAYWGGPPSLESVCFQTVSEPETRLATVRDGRADIATNLDPTVLDAPPGDFRIESRTNMLSTSIMLNLRVGPLADTRVRTALNLAVDVEGLIRVALHGAGVPLASAVGPEYFAHDPSITPHPYDPESARGLLADANAERFSLRLAVPSGRYPRGEEAAEYVARNLEEVGVDCVVEPLDWPAFVRGIEDKSHEAFYMQISTMATERLLANEFSSRTKGIGWHYYENPGVDDLVQRASETLDEHERAILLRGALRELHQDPPWIFLFNQADVYAVGPQVHGWEPLSNGFIDLSQTSRDDD